MCSQIFYKFHAKALVPEVSLFHRTLSFDCYLKYESGNTFFETFLPTLDRFLSGCKSVLSVLLNTYLTKQTFSCSNLAIEILVKNVKHVQSQQ